MIVIDAEKIQLFVLHNGRFSIEMISQQQKHDFFVYFSRQLKKTPKNRLKVAIFDVSLLGHPTKFKYEN